MISKLFDFHLLQFRSRRLSARQRERERQFNYDDFNHPSNANIFFMDCQLSLNNKNIALA
jgi:hypothetical protein